MFSFSFRSISHIIKYCAVVTESIDRNKSLWIHRFRVLFTQFMFLAKWIKNSRKKLSCSTERNRFSCSCSVHVQTTCVDASTRTRYKLLGHLTRELFSSTPMPTTRFRQRAKAYTVTRFMRKSATKWAVQKSAVTIRRNFTRTRLWRDRF